MNSFIICDTYYQVIFAVNLMYSLKKNDKVTLLITDQSNKSYDTYKRILEAKIFDKVFFARTKKKKNKLGNVILRIKEFICATTGIPVQRNLSYKNYDEFICCGPSLFAHAIYARLLKNNKLLKNNFFEEGVLSYKKDIEKSRRLKVLYKIRAFFKKKNLIDSAESFYCFYPQVYYGGLKCIKVPLVAPNSIVSDAIKTIFNISAQNNYKEKYIFFTSVYDFEGGDPIGELQVVKMIKELVGQDNLLVKKHPRDTRSVFEENNINVATNSSIPWEAIQLSQDFSDKVLLTATSGSVIGGNLFCSKPAKVFYVYPLCHFDNNKAALGTKNRIEEVFENNEMKKVLGFASVCSNLEEITHGYKG